MRRFWAEALALRPRSLHIASTRSLKASLFAASSWPAYLGSVRVRCMTSCQRQVFLRASMICSTSGSLSAEVALAASANAVRLTRGEDRGR